MPGDDITHPIPDLTGYITEGQIVVNRDLHRKGIYPPINVLPSLSRLMNLGIGKGHTREDHKKVSDQMYAGYAEGNDLRGLVAIVGKDALSERDRLLLEFADLFENRFVRQGYDEDRTIEDTLNLGWELLSTLPVEQLTRIDRELINKYHPKFQDRCKEGVKVHGAARYQANPFGTDQPQAEDPALRAWLQDPQDEARWTDP